MTQSARFMRAISKSESQGQASPNVRSEHKAAKARGRIAASIARRRCPKVGARKGKLRFVEADAESDAEDEPVCPNTCPQNVRAAHKAEKSRGHRTISYVLKRKFQLDGESSSSSSSSEGEFDGDLTSESTSESSEGEQGPQKRTKVAVYASCPEPTKRVSSMDAGHSSSSEKKVPEQKVKVDSVIIERSCTLKCVKMVAEPGQKELHITNSQITSCTISGFERVVLTGCKLISCTITKCDVEFLASTTTEYCTIEGCDVYSVNSKHRFDDFDNSNTKANNTHYDVCGFKLTNIASMRHCTLTNCTITECNSENAWLEHCTFDECHTEIEMSARTTFVHCTFTSGALKSKCDGTVFVHCVFSDTEIRSNFTGCSFPNSEINSCKLATSMFSNCDLYDVLFGDSTFGRFGCKGGHFMGDYLNVSGDKSVSKYYCMSSMCDSVVFRSCFLAAAFVNREADKKCIKVIDLKIRI